MREPNVLHTHVQQSPLHARGHVIIDMPDREIVIAYDDATALRRGTALTLAEALAIARYIEDALRHMMQQDRASAA